MAAVAQLLSACGKTTSEQVKPLHRKIGSSTQKTNHQPTMSDDEGDCDSPFVWEMEVDDEISFKAPPPRRTTIDVDLPTTVENSRSNFSLGELKIKNLVRCLEDDEEAATTSGYDKENNTRPGHKVSSSHNRRMSFLDSSNSPSPTSNKSFLRGGGGGGPLKSFLSNSPIVELSICQRLAIIRTII